MNEAIERVCEVCKYRNKRINEQPCWSCYNHDDRPNFEFDTDIMEQIHEVPNNNYDSHYNMSDHQPIEAMQANMTADEFIGFLKGNIIKYVCRMGRKDDVKKEASKIRRYAQWLEQAVSGETINPRE